MSSSATVNVHGTAIVIGTAGLLFIGPSGTGKSAVALHCIEAARARGLFAALVGGLIYLVRQFTSASSSSRHDEG